MYDNLPELIKNYPIGARIRIDRTKKDDYTYGKFVVDGYLYSRDGCWYPAHQIENGEWEIFTSK